MRGGPAAESASTVLRPVGALITLVAGHVDVIRGEKPEEGPVPLFARSYVYPGDRIVTGSDGRAELTMTKSARTVRVERASVLALEGRVEGEKIVIAGARVDTGAVWVKVSAGQEPFELGLGSVDARVSEGVVAVHRSGATRLVVFEGEAILGQDGQVVRAGEGVDISSSGAVGPFIADSEYFPKGGWRVAAATEGKTVAVVDGVVEASEPRRLTKAIRDLSPAIYLGIELELEGQGSGERFQASKARIRKIRVRSSAWDRLAAGQESRPAERNVRCAQQALPGHQEHGSSGVRRRPSWSGAEVRDGSQELIFSRPGRSAA